MSITVEDKLSSLGVKLPAAPAPVGSYVPVMITSNMVFVSGQVPSEDGRIVFKGKVGSDVSVEQGQQAARLCIVNALAQLKASLGDLEKIKKVVKVAGFVNCGPDFADHAKVVNGASDFLVQVFEENGKHVRVSVGASSLPMNSAVEVELTVEIKAQD